MTGNETLREMLDERGVEWEDMSARLPTGMLWCTEWTSQDGEPCTAIEGADDIPDGKLSVQALLTPAQVIAATLGAVRLEKAKAKRMPNVWGFSSYYCGCCGHKLAEVANGLNEHFPNYCESCGTKAVYE